MKKHSLLLGGGLHIYSYLTIPISLFNTAMIAAVFYNNVIRVTPWLSWINVWLFLSVFIVCLIVGGIIIWRLVIPNVQAYQNFINYKHGNLVARDIAEIKEMLKGNK